MNPHYAIRDTSRIYSPALLFYKDLIRTNINRAIEMAGDPERLRPHVKTHKTREIVRMGLEAGIRKHKCATIAEAEMVASCDAPDVLIAYPLVGPNCGAWPGSFVPIRGRISPSLPIIPPGSWPCRRR